MANRHQQNPLQHISTRTTHMGSTHHQFFIFYHNAAPTFRSFIGTIRRTPPLHRRVLGHEKAGRGSVSGSASTWGVPRVRRNARRWGGWDAKTVRMPHALAHPPQSEANATARRHGQSWHEATKDQNGGIRTRSCRLGLPFDRRCPRAAQ